MRKCARGDGSYPFDRHGVWKQILTLSEEAALALLGGETLTNKEFKVIKRFDWDSDYEDWDEAGREVKLIDKKYFPAALAVYKHDFSWYLIQKIS